jgi:pimeloyl-ACP methyl ester carboxylesterase
VEKGIMATQHELAAQAEPVAHEDLVTSYKDTPTRTVSAGGINFAYRALSPKTGVPVPHPPGRGAGQLGPSGRRRHCRKAPVVTFDNRGVGASTGSTPDTIHVMAKDAINFIRALGLDEVDLLAFSRNARWT